MAGGSQEEFPPLLGPGFQEMRLDDLRRLCVARFPDSITRPKIMGGLERVLQKLNQSGLPMEAWIDGSFLTHKLNPDDSDLVARIDGAVYDRAMPDQKLVAQWIGEADLKADYHCDNYCFVEYASPHPLGGVGEWSRAYWIRQFGFSRGVEMKGMVAVKLPFIVV